jgi:hypothetical protein
MSRLTIDMTEEQHKALKAMAALQGKTIKQYTLEKLFPDNAGEDRAWAELTKLLNDRIDRALAGEVSNKTFDEIVSGALEAPRQP